jgi:hypothetical protein
MLLEGIKQWPAVYEDAYCMPAPIPGMYVDASPLCVLLQQLLYAGAPADVMSGVISHLSTSMVPLFGRYGSNNRSRHMPADYDSDWLSLKLWFCPPALMGTAEGVAGMQREDVRSSKLPDLLSAAVNMNAGNSKLPIIKAVSVTCSLQMKVAMIPNTAVIAVCRRLARMHRPICTAA